MRKKIPVTLLILFLFGRYAHAQIGLMELVGKNTSNYTIGFGALVKSGFPVTEGSDLI